jgi:hypothetical protein
MRFREATATHISAWGALHAADTVFHGLSEGGEIVKPRARELVHPRKVTSQFVIRSLSEWAADPALPMATG